jgi:hypothetical protein
MPRLSGRSLHFTPLAVASASLNETSRNFASALFADFRAGPVTLPKLVEFG